MSFLLLKRKASSPCESKKVKAKNLDVSDDSFKSLEEMQEELLSDVVTVRIVKKNGEPFVGALGRPQCLAVWVSGLKQSASLVIGISLIQYLDKPFMADFKLNQEVDVNSLSKSFEAEVDKNQFTGEIVFEKPPPPKLGEEVRILIKQTRFKIKPEQASLWIQRFGTLVSAAKYVTADDLPQVTSDDIECTAKLRKHIPGLLPAHGRKVSIRYPGQPLQCGQCYQYGHLRKKCPNQSVEWKSYVGVFVKEKIVPAEYVGSWINMLNE